MKFNRNIHELEGNAILWWPEYLNQANAAISVIPKLLQTQGDFLKILSLSKTNPYQVFDLLEASEFPVNLFLKHLCVLADYGGEPIQRLGRAFSAIFQHGKNKHSITFSWNSSNYTYNFKHLPIRGLGNKKLFIDGEGLIEEKQLTDLYKDIIVLLMFGSTSTVSDEAGLVACEVGTLLGKTEILEQYVKERYINVSRITGGATANSLGQLAQKEIVRYLSQSLSQAYSVISNGTIALVGYEKENGMPFDIVVEKGVTKVGIEVSFQVTTNSTIERKARGTLFFDVERILSQKKPEYFLLENVRGLITHDEGRTYQTIKEKLEAIGYSVDYLLLNSSNYGVPQNRVRIYILGVMQGKLSLTLNSDLGASDTHKFKLNTKNFQESLFEEEIIKPRVVKDILEKTPDSKYECSPSFRNKLKNVVGEDFTQLNGYRLIDYRGGKSLHSWELGVKGACASREIEFMNLLIANRRKKIFGTHQDGKRLTREQIETFYFGKNFESVTSSLINKGYLSCYDGQYNPVCGNMSFEVFKFLDPDGISITLTASDSNRLGVIQNNIARRITPRECARLQGYPDSYKLLDNDNAVYKQMGNGVSVPVVKAVLVDFIAQNVKNS